MAKYILGNDGFFYQGAQIKKGKVIDDANYDVVALALAGAVLILLPNAVVEARAAQVRIQQSKGLKGGELLDLVASRAEDETGGGGSVNSVTFHAPLVQSGTATDPVADLPNATPSSDGTQSAADKTKIDGIAAGATNTPLSNLNPSAIQPDAPGAPGVSTAASRRDHTHAITTDPPVNIGTTNSEGASANFVRADHIHALTEAVVRTVLAGALGVISVNGQVISSVAPPVASSDAATKGYADAVAQGFNFKNPASVVATSNLTLSGEQTIDGVLTSASRVLVTGQTTGTQNGIYTSAAGAWSRVADLPVGADASGVFLAVLLGTVNASSLWLCSNNPAIVGTNTLTFIKLPNVSLGSATPSAMTPDQTGSSGSSAFAAHEDHVHAIPTAAAGTLSIGDTSAKGSSSSYARADHTHAFPAPAAPADVTKAAAATGSSANAARADHKHDVSVAAPVVVTFGAAAQGTSTSLSRADHVHLVNAPGAPANVTKAAAASGASANFAREDHKHDVSTAVPVAIGANLNVEGTATSLARSDHRHAGNPILTVEHTSNQVTAAGITAYFIPLGCYFYAAAGETTLTINGVPQVLGTDYFHFERGRGAPPSVADAAIGFALASSPTPGQAIVFKWLERRILISPLAVAKVRVPDPSTVWLSDSPTVHPNAVTVSAYPGYAIEFWRMPSRAAGTDFRRGRRYMPYFRGAADVFTFRMIEDVMMANAPGGGTGIPSHRHHFRVCYYDFVTGARSALSTDKIVLCSQNRADYVNGREVRAKASTWIE